METLKKEEQQLGEVTTDPVENVTDAVAPVAEVEQKKKVVDNLSDSDEEEVLTDAEKALWEKINEVLKEYHLSAFQALAARKFIKDKVGNPKDESVDRLRGWLFMKVNG